MLEDIQTSITQLAEGRGLTHDVAKSMVLDGLESVGWVMFRMNGISRVSTWMCDAIVSFLHGVFSSVGIKRCVMNYAPY